MKINNINGTSDRYLFRKRLLGLLLGLVLGVILLNVDKKLWLPLELETVNNRNKWSNLFFQESSGINKVAIVLFDDRTQFLLRQNGLPIKDFEKKGRDLISTAILKLESYKVKAVGLNLNLDAPGDKSQDDLLANTISKYKNIVAASSIYSATPYRLNSVLKNAAKVGYGELYSDFDKVVHKVTLVDKEHFGLQSFSYSLFNLVSMSDVQTSLKSKNEFYLRYPALRINSYSFIDLIHGKINPSELTNKTVILGTGLKSKLLKDQLLSPYDKGSFISDSEAQAVAFLNLLNQSHLVSFSLKEYAFHFLIFSMILGIIFSSIPVIHGALIGSMTLVSIILFSFTGYVFYHTLVDLIPLLLILLFNFVIGSLIYLQLNLQEQNIGLNEALGMLSKRSSELETSQKQLESRNIQLSKTLGELHKRMGELIEVRKQLTSRSEDERKRIARELHDDTLARITDLRIYMESLINSGDLPLKEKKQLGITVKILQDVTFEIRRVINALRPSMLDNALGLIPAIENLLDLLVKRSGNKIEAKLITSISRLKLVDSCEINLYRIIQEALNNVFKHSNASKVEIVMEEQPGQFLVIVRDNGVGLRRKSQNAGFGLMDMKERAELIGATMQFLTSPGGGTTVEITIPADKVQEIGKARSPNRIPSSVSRI